MQILSFSLVYVYPHPQRLPISPKGRKWSRTCVFMIARVAGRKWSRTCVSMIAKVAADGPGPLKPDSSVQNSCTTCSRNGFENFGLKVLRVASVLCVGFKADSHDLIFGSDFSLALCQPLEMLIRVRNFFQFE